MSMDEVEESMDRPEGIPSPGSIIRTGSAKPKQPSLKDPWVHRIERLRCNSCMFYVPKQTVSLPKLGVGIGRCRRHAPTMSGYPVVFANDWCGDHKLDENKT